MLNEKSPNIEQLVQDVNSMTETLSNQIYHLNLTCASEIKKCNLEIKKLQSVVREKDAEIHYLKELLDQNGIGYPVITIKPVKTIYLVSNQHVDYAQIQNVMDSIRTVTLISYEMTLNEFIESNVTDNDALYIIVVQNTEELNFMSPQFAVRDIHYILIYRQHGDFIPKDEKWICVPFVIGGSPSSYRALSVKIHQFLLQK